MQLDDPLWAICQTEYFPRNLRLRSPITRVQYAYAINDLRQFLGRATTLADLNDDTFAAWLNWLATERGLAEISANGKADRIRALWTWLAKRGRVPTFPTVGKIPVPESLPLAWSPDELARLYLAAGKMPGRVGPFLASAWWQALIAWLWCTGARIGETLAMEWEHVDLVAGVASLPAKIRKQRKKGAVYRIWPDVVALLAKLQRPSGKVFIWERCQVTYYLHYGKLLKLAGLPTGRKRKSHAIRVSHATFVQAMGGDATKRLMHGDEATTRAHYLDRRFLPDSDVKLFRPWE